MIIQTDTEGRGVIEQLCDLALKQGGVSNLNQVNTILSSVHPLAIEENPQPKSLEKNKEKVKDSKSPVKKE